MGCNNSKVTPSRPATAIVLPIDKTAKSRTYAQKTDAPKFALHALFSLRTIDIIIKKAPNNDRIGLLGINSEDVWLVLEIEDGLVKGWNEQHPDLAVEIGDQIVACNGVQGDGQMVCKAIQKDMILNITVAKNASVTPEEKAHSEASTPGDASPQDDVSDTAFERQTTLDSAPASTRQIFVEAVSKLDDVPRLKASDQVVMGATSIMETMEEQALPDNDPVEPARKPDGWMCCSGPKTANGIMKM